MNAKEYREKNYIDLPLPSGSIFKVRPVNALRALNLVNLVPDSIRLQMSKESANIKEQTFDDIKALSNDFSALLATLIIDCVAEPKISMHNNDDDLYIYDISNDDIEALCDYVLSQLGINIGELKDISPFR